MKTLIHISIALDVFLLYGFFVIFFSREVGGTKIAAFLFGVAGALNLFLALSSLGILKFTF